MVESLIEPELLLGQVITASRQAVKHSPRGDKAMRDGREQRQQQQQQQPWQHRPWPHRRSQTVSLFFFQVSTETEHKPKLNAIPLRRKAKYICRSKMGLRLYGPFRSGPATSAFRPKF